MLKGPLPEREPEEEDLTADQEDERNIARWIRLQEISDAAREQEILDGSFRRLNNAIKYGRIKTWDSM